MHVLIATESSTRYREVVNSLSGIAQLQFSPPLLVHAHYVEAARVRQPELIVVPLTFVNTAIPALVGELHSVAREATIIVLSENAGAYLIDLCRAAGANQIFDHADEQTHLRDYVVNLVHLRVTRKTHNDLSTEYQRLAALKSYEILDTPPEPQFDEITAAAAHLFGVPMALISLVDEDRQWFKSRVGLNLSNTSRAVSFCSRAILQKQVLVVEDASQDIRFKDNPLVLEEPRIRFYAGVPLINAHGYALGTLCVLDSAPHQPSEQQLEFLRLLGRLTLSSFEVRRTTQQLVREVHAREHLTDSLQHLHSVHDMFVDSIGGIVAEFDVAQAKLSYLSDSVERLLGWSRTWLLEQDKVWRDVVHPEDRFRVFRAFCKAMLKGIEASVQFRVVSEAGRVLWFSGSMQSSQSGLNQTRMLMLLHDITEIKRREEEARHEATRDEETGLPHEALLNEVLDLQIRVSRRRQTRVAVMYVEVDRFTHSEADNDASDIGMRETARRLFVALRQSDYVARIGENRFAIVLADLKVPEDAGAVATAILAENARWRSPALASTRAGCKLGIAVFPDDGDDGETIRRNALLALRETLRSGVHGYQFFANGMRERSIRTAQFASMLHQALKVQQLQVRFAPVFGADKRQCIGVKARVYWQHENHGMIPIDALLPALKRQPLLQEKGAWGLNEAARHWHTWSAQVRGCMLYLNVTPGQMRESLLQVLPRVLVEFRMAGQTITLVMSGPVDAMWWRAAAPVIERVRQLGVKIGLAVSADGDAGLPILNAPMTLDAVLVQPPFSVHSEEDVRARTMIQSAVALARAKEIAVGAICVDDELQAQFVEALALDFYAGAHYGTEREASEMTRLLEQQVLE